MARVVGTLQHSFSPNKSNKTKTEKTKTTQTTHTKTHRN